MPLAEHDDIRPHMRQNQSGFNSRAPRGARLPISTVMRCSPTFQFTCPSRSTTSGRRHKARTNKFQFTCPSRSTTAVSMMLESSSGVSIHVPLAEHDSRPQSSGAHSQVSIHVPLAEHDVSRHSARACRLVSIHVPLAEHDRSESRLFAGGSTFQFTCPSRSTTAHQTSLVRL